MKLNNNAETTTSLVCCVSRIGEYSLIYITFGTTVAGERKEIRNRQKERESEKKVWQKNEKKKNHEEERDVVSS